MNKNNAVLYALLIILLPLAILILSGNGVLRVSGTYGFYFNDIQASAYIDSSLNNNELASEITGYFNSFDDDEFQIYEKNGEFIDPVFDNSEVLAMKQAKSLLKGTLIAGGVLFVLVIALYIYLLVMGEKKHLRTSGVTAAVATIAALVAKILLVSNTTVRTKLYDKYIGVSLNEESSLRLLLGTPMERIYLIFSTIFAIIILAIFLYAHLSITKERGMFKRN